MRRCWKIDFGVADDRAEPSAHGHGLATDPRRRRLPHNDRPVHVHNGVLKVCVEMDEFYVDRGSTEGWHVDNSVERTSEVVCCGRYDYGH